MERETNPAGEPASHADQAHHRAAEEEAADAFEHNDVEWYAVLGED
jgi:hypothetical protein